MDTVQAVFEKYLDAPFRLDAWRILSENPALWSDEGVAHAESERRKTRREKDYNRLQDLSSKLLLFERCRSIGPERAFFGRTLNDADRNYFESSVPAEVTPVLAKWREFRKSSKWDELFSVLEELIAEKKDEYHPLLIAELRMKAAKARLECPIGDRPENIETAIAVYESVVKARPRDMHPESWATAAHALGMAHYFRVRGDRAENIEKTIAFLEEAVDVHTRESFPVQWANINRNMATSYLFRIRGNRLENLETAIARMDAALEVYTRDDFPKNWAGSLQNLAVMYRNRIRGDRAENLDRALGFLESALDIMTRDRFPFVWGLIQHSMGVIRCERLRGDRTANLEKAISLFEGALEVRTRDRYPEYWAMSRVNLANAYLDRAAGDPAENVEKAIEGFHEVFDVWTCDRNPEGWATAMRNLATSYTNRTCGDRGKNLRTAAELGNNSLEVFTREAYPAAWAQSQKAVADAYAARVSHGRAWDPVKAAAHYKDALGAVMVHVDPRRYREWAIALTRLHVLEQNWTEALESARLAHHADRILQRNATSTAGRTHEIEEGASLYYLASHSSARLGDLPGAVRWLEQGKTRELGEALARDRSMFERDLRAEHRLEYRRLMERLGELEAEQRGAIPGGRSFVPVAEEAGRVHAGLERLVEEIRRYVPDFQREKRVSIEETGSFPAGENTVRILFNVTEFGTVVFFLARAGGERFADLIFVDDFTTATLEKLALEWLAALDRMRSKKITDEIDRAGVKLHDLLFAPVRRWLMEHGRSVEHLILIPHLTLHVLPLHLVRYRSNGAERYLLEDFEVSYAPSLSLLLERTLAGKPEVIEDSGSAAEGDEGDRPGRAPRKEDMLIVSNPTGDLAWSSVEVDSIAGRFPSSCRVVSESDATKKQVMDLSRRAKYLHLSCHGIFDFEDSWNSGIVLAPAEPLPEAEQSRDETAHRETAPPEAGLTGDAAEQSRDETAHRETVCLRDAAGRKIFEIKSYEDGSEDRITYGGDGSVRSRVRALPGGSQYLEESGELLTLNEIVGNLDLSSTELVVLSACETGIVGFGGRSDEFVGLPGGFLRAGARKIVASLWAVDDFSTALFMDEFYRGIVEENLPPRKALRRAQLTFMSESKWQNPFFWGAFRILES